MGNDISIDAEFHTASRNFHWFLIARASEEIVQDMQTYLPLGLFEDMRGLDDRYVELVYAIMRASGSAQAETARTLLHEAALDHVRRMNSSQLAFHASLVHERISDLDDPRTFKERAIPAVAALIESEWLRIAPYVELPEPVLEPETEDSPGALDPAVRRWHRARLSRLVLDVIGEMQNVEAGGLFEEITGIENLWDEASWAIMDGTDEPAYDAACSTIDQFAAAEVSQLLPEELALHARVLWEAEDDDAYPYPDGELVAKEIVQRVVDAANGRSFDEFGRIDGEEEDKDDYDDEDEEE